MSRESILAAAESDLGLAEYPPRSNRIKYNDWYYEGTVINADWCATAVSYWYFFGGHPLPRIDSEQGFAYVPTMYYYAKKNNLFTDKPEPVDIVIYDFNGDGKWDHTGLFEKWSLEGKSSWAIEGNTTPQRYIRDRSLDTEAISPILSGS